jgi:signal transduction histidine kinase
MAHRETDSSVCLRTPSRVLIYDAWDSTAGLAALIAAGGYDVQRLSDRHRALEEFHSRDFPLVLVRTNINGEGLDFVSQAHAPRNTIFIAVTDCMGCESAVQSLRAGMRDYVVWPGSAEEIRHALQRAFEEVEHARFREDMLSMLTHDIKIPLSSILGYSSLIFDKDTGELSPRAQDFIKIISASGLKILTLIDNFLTTNKIDSGRLHLCLDEISLAPFLDDLANTFEVEMDRHNLALSLNVPHDLPAIEADEGLLFRAIGNLLSNACKFSPPGSQVSITAYVSSLPGSNECELPAVAIEVCNEGPGLSPHEIPEIFERFKRGRAQGSIEGSGLGAYVVKSIAEAHGGKVEVTSVPNELTRFSIYLPLKVV